MNLVEEGQIPLEGYFNVFAAHWGMDPSAAMVLGLACLSAVAGPSIVVRHPLEGGTIPVTFSFILHSTAPLVARSAINSALAPVFDWIEERAQDAFKEGRSRTQLRLVKANEELLRKEFAATQTLPAELRVLESAVAPEISTGLAKELEALKDQISLAHVQLKLAILTKDLDTQTLLKPWDISFDSTIVQVGDLRNLQQWIRLPQEEAHALQELFHVSWNGGVLHRGATPCPGRMSYLIGSEQAETEEILPKVARIYPGILDQLVVVSTGGEGRVAESDLATDQWQGVLDKLLKCRVSGKVRRCQLSQEAHRLFVQVYNSALNRRCHQRVPVLSLKFAALLQSVIGEWGPAEISDSIFTRALQMALSVSKSGETVVTRENLPPKSPLEILIAKVRAKGPTTVRELVRSYSNQKTDGIRVLLEEATQKGIIIHEGNRYRVAD